MPNNTSRATIFRLIACVQAALFTALSLFAAGIVGLGLLFALDWQPQGHIGRHEVWLGVALAAAIVLPPALVATAAAVAAAQLRRHPRAAAVLLLVGEIVGAAFLLWPRLRPLIFALPASRAIALVDLTVTLPAVVVAVRTLTSDGVRAELPGRRRTSAASSAGRRH